MAARRSPRRAAVRRSATARRAARGGSHLSAATPASRSAEAPTRVGHRRTQSEAACRRRIGRRCMPTRRQRWNRRPARRGRTQRGCAPGADRPCRRLAPCPRAPCRRHHRPRAAGSGVLDQLASAGPPRERAQMARDRAQMARDRAQMARGCARRTPSARAAWPQCECGRRVRRCASRRRRSQWSAAAESRSGSRPVPERPTGVRREPRPHREEGGSLARPTRARVRGRVRVCVRGPPRIASCACDRAAQGTRSPCIQMWALPPPPERAPCAASKFGRTSLEKPQSWSGDEAAARAKFCALSSFAAAAASWWTSECVAASKSLVQAWCTKRRCGSISVPASQYVGLPSGGVMQPRSLRSGVRQQQNVLRTSACTCGAQVITQRGAGVGVRAWARAARETQRTVTTRACRCMGMGAHARGLGAQGWGLATIRGRRGRAHRGVADGGFNLDLAQSAARAEPIPQDACHAEEQKCRQEQLQRQAPGWFSPRRQSGRRRQRGRR